MPLKVLIAIDKFKGSLTSLRAAVCVREGFLSSSYSFLFDIVPIADGGDGSLDVVRSVWKGLCETVKCCAHDPLGRVMECEYLLLYSPEGGPPKAFIEMAKVCGLVLLGEDERNPLKTSTYGLGEVILDAAGHGAGEIYLSIGGSATNDGGAGMLQALGFGFFSGPTQGRRPITEHITGEILQEITYIAPPFRPVHGVYPLPLSNGEPGLSLSADNPAGGARCDRFVLNVICDVTNPLLGPDGATYVYAPQKGASENDLKTLECGMENYANVCSGCFGDTWKGCGFSGAGAAGGTGFAAGSLLAAHIIKGWEFFFDLTCLEQRIAEADIVVSGEGRIDTQSLSGKLIEGIGLACRRTDKPLLLFCGTSDIGEQELKEAVGTNNVKIFTLSSIEPDIRKSMENAGQLLQKLAAFAIGNEKGYRL